MTALLIGEGSIVFLNTELERSFLSFLEETRGKTDIDETGITDDYFSRLVAYWNEVVEGNCSYNRIKLESDSRSADMLAFMNTYFHTTDVNEKRFILGELRKIMLIIGGKKP